MHRTRKHRLEALYRKYNRRRYVHPDPLEFLYDYTELRDRELAALVASSLAYGRVKQILKSVASILAPMGASPYGFLMETSDRRLRSTYDGFVHRFTRGTEMVRMLMGAREVAAEYGSLHHAFSAGVQAGHATVLPAMERFCRRITDASGGDLGHLLPLPERGSACKRLNLFLRWMVRTDAVDPGGWDRVSPGALIVPLDVHMHRVGVALGFTQRKQADMRTALEVTDGFRGLVPDDPVRYDFVLTRPGIRGDLGGEEFVV